jgi:integrase
MGSIRTLASKGTLFMDFRYAGQRLREYTVLPDTPTNRKRLQKALDRIETEIAIGNFDYAKTFGKPLAPSDESAEPDVQPAMASMGGFASRPAHTPLFTEFANQWFTENAVQWRRSYCITQRGALDKYLIPHFGAKTLGEITKADVLGFRADLAKMQGRKADATLSNRRVNAVMKPLRQILNEAADRFEFNTSFRNIKPLKIKRSDVMPFSLQEVHAILERVRPDYKPYFTVRFFTGMRTGEVHGLKWKYIDFEHRLILVRESIVLGEEDDLKTDGSQRDIHMTQMVYEALRAQFERTGKAHGYVFANQSGNPLDNKNFINRVWAPLLRHLGLTHRKAYQMRHTAATLWLASGESPEWIARQLGHTSTEMLFRVYSRFVPNLTRQDGSAFDRLLTQTFADKLPATVIRLPTQAHGTAPQTGPEPAAPPAEAQPPPMLGWARAPTPWRLSAHP